MSMSDYVRALRALIGSTVLEIPTVAVLAFDDAQRALLVRHVEGNEWTTPGGMVEPYETPADAAVRETWEETGLLVELTRVVGVFGGARCAATYANGDRVSWVATAFAARPLRGTLRHDGVETLEARYFSREETRALRCKSHVLPMLDAACATPPRAYFDPPTWTPPVS